MKTLAVILHHNTPQYTDVLYELLEPEQESGNYDLVVIDNGSDVGKGSKYATHKLDENVFFGGGIDSAMRLVLESNDYDSLLFLNSDLIVGKNFVKSLRLGAGYHNVPNVENPINYDIVSPCIIQPEKTQNHWKQMLSWGMTETRKVKWIDLQCPLISRRFIQHIHDTKTTENYIDPLLIRGWGIDVLFGIICKAQGWKVGVCGNVPVVHLGSMTMKSLGNTNEYCRLAEQGMNEYFQKNQLMKEFNEMRKWAETYTI